MTASAASDPGGWERVVGQDRAVALLRAAAARPVHAYLLVGPPGAGVVEAARCFAAALVAPGDDRALGLALRGRHPDVVEIDPAENQIRVRHAQEVLTEVHAAPVEGERKVVVVFDAERLNEAAANKLLKTLEEPPPRAVLVLVTAGADQLLPTVRSRCQRVDFVNLPVTAVARALEADGVEPERAALAAGLAGGRLDRARALDGRLAGVRDAFAGAPAALDGSGAAVSHRVAEVQAVLRDAMQELERAQAAEADALVSELAAAGYPERVAGAQVRRLAEQHERAHRHARTELLLEGITALETVYRDALAGDGAPRLNADRPVLEVAPGAAGAALDACRAARRVLVEHNPNERLLLERLFLCLPATPPHPRPR